jgi:hypothetical protein
MSSGLAQRTIKNLDFIKNAQGAGVHPVTQVINSLLGLLVFPVEKEESFLATFAHVQFPDPSDLAVIQTTLIEHFSVPSLHVEQFEHCKDLSVCFKKIRNAISHKHLEFSGNPDSRILREVTVTLKDRLPAKQGKPAEPFHWEIRMNAEDLEKLSRYVAEKIISWEHPSQT